MTILTYMLVGLGAALALVLFAPPAVNAACRGPLKFVERVGEDPWFGPVWTRFKFWWGLGLSGRMEITIRPVRLPAEKGSTIKIFGLACLSPARQWPWTAKRVQRYGWKEYADIAHEDSARIIGRAGRGADAGALVLRSYTYTEARGGIGGPDQPKPPSEPLGRVAVGAEATLIVEITRSAMTYRTETPDGTHTASFPLTRPAWAFWKCGPHSRGVTPDVSQIVSFIATKP